MNGPFAPAARRRPATTAPPKVRARVLISHQGCVPVYRKPLYDRLSRIADIEYVVAYGEPPRGTHLLTAPEPYGFPTLRIDNHELSFGGKALIWQPLVRRYWREFDLAVLGHEIKYLSSLVMLASAKVLRKPVLLWGFGTQRGGDGYRRSWAQKVVAGAAHRLLQPLLLKLADGYLVYTDAGRRSLVEAGFPEDRIATLRNTVDIDRQAELRRQVAGEPEAECRARLGLPPDGDVLLYFGRLLPDKQVGLLIDYVRQARAAGRNARAVILGAGPEEARLRALAGPGDAVVFLPHDDHDLARALRVCAAVVIPGFVGLAVTHGFAHGRPMITREGRHPPEIEYLADGENGLITPADPDAFFAALDGFLDDPHTRARLAEGADRAARSLAIEHMVDGMDQLVRRVLAARAPRTAAS